MVENDLFEKLDDLLDQEREALLAGKLDMIADLVAEKEQLIEKIVGTDGPERQRLVALQTKAMRNQALLDSTLQGIRTVANRFATLRRIRKSLETYDESGNKSIVPSAPVSKVERRA